MCCPVVLPAIPGRSDSVFVSLRDLCVDLIEDVADRSQKGNSSNPTKSPFRVFVVNVRVLQLEQDGDRGPEWTPSRKGLLWWNSSKDVTWRRNERYSHEQVCLRLRVAGSLDFL